MLKNAARTHGQISNSRLPDLQMREPVLSWRAPGHNHWWCCPTEALLCCHTSAYAPAMQIETEERNKASRNQVRRQTSGLHLAALRRLRGREPRRCTMCFSFCSFCRPELRPFLISATCSLYLLCFDVGVCKLKATHLTSSFTTTQEKLVYHLRMLWEYQHSVYLIPVSKLKS